MSTIEWLIKNNPGTDIFWVPRINTVKGLTQEHIDKWGWRVDDQGWVNFPDWQMRIYRNDDNIYWNHSNNLFN